MRDLVSDQGSNLCLMHWDCGILATGAPGEFLQHVEEKCIHCVKEKSLAPKQCLCPQLLRVLQWHPEHQGFMMVPSRISFK